jgi:hypothetical protein
MKTRTMKPILFMAVLLIANTLLLPVRLPAADIPGVQLNVENVGPREVEDQTEKALVRDYGAAWAGLGRALEQNQPSQLGDLWAGSARRLFLDAIQQQKQSGLRVRYLDTRHQLKAIFYSPEGNALELQDTAQIERQILDGDKVVDSDDAHDRPLAGTNSASDAVVRVPS